MNKEDRQLLRDKALAAREACKDRDARNADRQYPDWELQTSNSFRRIGARGDGDVLHATTHPRDHFPDLAAPAGVLDYIVAAQPQALLELLDYVDMLESDEVLRALVMSVANSHDGSDLWGHLRQDPDAFLREARINLQQCIKRLRRKGQK